MTLQLFDIIRLVANFKSAILKGNTKRDYLILEVKIPEQAIFDTISLITLIKTQLLPD